MVIEIGENLVHILALSMDWSFWLIVGYGVYRLIMEEKIR
jgi:hypothetical protein